LPTVIASAYYFLIASDQFESEARFIVRSASKPDMPGSLGFLVQLGFGRAHDDSFIVQEFITSRDAVSKLEAVMPLRKFYGRHEADFLARYPSILFNASNEEFYEYFRRMLDVGLVDKTGISHIRARAFKPEDAERIVEQLLVFSEQLVNRINERLQKDAVDLGQQRLEAAERRLVDAQAALTDFRNRELLIDPSRNAVALSELIGKLSAERATTHAEIAALRPTAGASPQVADLMRREAALHRQIGEERARIAGDATGLASRMAEFERLSLEREFASSVVKTAETDLVKARQAASKQLLYLERVSGPNLSDYPTKPRRTRVVVTIFAANMLLILVSWLLLSGVKEHLQEVPV
jgi:capsular polysaccharide transport system permease protein